MALAARTGVTSNNARGLRSYREGRMKPFNDCRVRLAWHDAAA
jgi:hypothetical protein